MMTPGDIARIYHAANRAYCATLGDYTPRTWSTLPLWQRRSALDGVLLLQADPTLTPAQLHAHWLASQAAQGWVYGPILDRATKQDPCCLPYADLPPAQRRKDQLFVAIVRACLEEV